MPHSPRLSRWRSLQALSTVAILSIALASSPPEADAAVIAGGIAILGYTDYNTDSDTFSIAAMENIAAGTVLYFTDNGWDNTFGQFYGQGTNLGQTNGNEGLTKLIFNSNVAAGTVMRSGLDGAGYEWKASVIVNDFIPGGSLTVSDTFTLLPLNSDASIGDGGDQISVFEAPAFQPLTSGPKNFIFLFDKGDFHSPGFEDVNSDNTGQLHTGLSVAAKTAVEFPDLVAGDDAGDFHNGSFALNMGDPDVIALQFTGGTKSQWLNLVTDHTNWLKINYEDDNGGDAEQFLSALNFTIVPEPSRAVLLVLGLAAGVFRRTRKA